MEKKDELNKEQLDDVNGGVIIITDKQKAVADMDKGSLKPSKLPPVNPKARAFATDDQFHK